MPAQATPPPAGIYVPVPTFFAAADDSTGSAPLDLAAQTAHTLFLARAGIRGLVLLGSTGEAILVRGHERGELIGSQRRALDAAGFGHVAVIAGTATQNVEETVELIGGAREAGAEFAMVLAPGYFAAATGQRGLQRWFEAVAERASLPVLIYHYPGVTNNLYIAPSTFEKLAAHPNIVGTKLSHGIIDDQTLIAASPNIDHAHFAVFTGLGQNLLPVLAIGGVAAIDGLAGCFPRVVVRLFRLFTESSAAKEGGGGGGVTKADLDGMRELQFRICEGEKLVATWGVVGMKEAIARLWGIGDGKGGRLPLAGGFQEGEKEWAKWEEVFLGLKALEQRFEKEG